jgi:predicted  nucleic acid-binding Zn-ribbon protein
MSDERNGFDPTPSAGTVLPPSEAPKQPVDDWFASFVSAAGTSPQRDEAIDHVELERQELEAALQTARKRVEVARQELSAKDAEMRSVLRREVTAAKERLDEMELRHADQLQSVREAGRADAERIIAEARSEVSRIRRGASSGVSDVG